jgi:hypothetical protein
MRVGDLVKLVRQEYDRLSEISPMVPSCVHTDPLVRSCVRSLLIQLTTQNRYCTVCAFLCKITGYFVQTQ